MIDALERECRKQIRRRGMWSAPPACFGHDMYSRWTDEGAARCLAMEFTGDVLTAELGRFQVLLGNPKNDINAYVARCLHRYLGKRQSSADPIGARCYANVKQLLVKGWLEHDGSAEECLASGGRAWRSARPPRDSETASPQLFGERLTRLRSWPAMVESAGHGTGKGVAKILAAGLDELRAEGCVWIYPSELHKTLAEAARENRKHQDHDFGGPRTPLAVEESLNFLQLRELLTQEIERGDYRRPKREGLQRTLQAIARRVEADEVPIRQTEVARALKLSSSAVQSHVSTLREILLRLVDGDLA